MAHLFGLEAPPIHLFGLSIVFFSLAKKSHSVIVGYQAVVVVVFRIGGELVPSESVKVAHRVIVSQVYAEPDDVNASDDDSLLANSVNTMSSSSSVLKSNLPSDFVFRIRPVLSSSFASSSSSSSQNPTPL